MKTKRSFYKIFCLLPLVLLLLNACKHENLQIDKPSDSFRPAFDFIKNNYDLSLFAAAVEKVGIAAQLNTGGPYTILAPNNKAFNLIGIKRPEDFDRMNPDTLKFLVQRHILNERLQIQDLPVNGIDVRYRTMAGTEVYASNAEDYDGPMVYFDGSYVSRKDVVLANGTLHVLDWVMKSTANTTVQDWLASRPEYSILVSGLKKFGYWDELATEGPYTILAPKNNRFEAAGFTMQEIAGLDTSRYVAARLFGCYVMRNKHIFLSDMVVFNRINNDGAYTFALPGDTYYASMSAGRANLVVGDYTLAYSINIRSAKDYPYEDVGHASGRDQTAMDNLTDNGIVHDLQGVLVLPAQALKR